MAFSNYTPSPRPKNFGQTAQAPQTGENNSGQGPNTPVPDIVARKFNWGAFLLSWIWGLGNKTYITLLMFVGMILSIIPIIGGFIVLGLLIWFGIEGNTWAWQNKRFESIEHFHEYQKKWVIAGIVVLFLNAIIICMIWAATFSILSKEHSYSMNDAYKLRYVNTIETSAMLKEATEQKCNLTSNGLAMCFEDAFINGERIGNSIKPSSYDKDTILVFEGNGVCKQTGDCKVTIQTGEGKNQETSELPLYINDTGYIYIKKEDHDKILNTNK